MHQNNAYTMYDDSYSPPPSLTNIHYKSTYLVSGYPLPNRSISEKKVPSDKPQPSPFENAGLPELFKDLECLNSHKACRRILTNGMTREEDDPGESD
ncbi:MAG: hypothetical protein Q9190_003982 [Brigantiaea leucoxantha]